MIKVVKDIYTGNNGEEITCYMVTGGPEDARPRGSFLEEQTSDGWWKVWIKYKPSYHTDEE